MIALLVCLFLGNIPSFVFSGSSDLKINCLIINREYVNCTWSEDEPKHNYSFRGRFLPNESQECPKYHKINVVNVGCVFPYVKVQRFNNFETWLYFQNGTEAKHQEDNLKDYVKLNPPVNLSLVEIENAELQLYWNFTTSKNCVESQVRYRTDNKEWKSPNPGTRLSFSLPFPSRKRYEFQVRARISNSCGQSKFWSEWSEPVFREFQKLRNDTEIPSMVPLVLYIVGATILLTVLSCLLVHSERLRIILIPVVPNAGRNVSKYLAAFFDNYDGNVDKWLSMPKDLENGFKPNFTERACPVREYRVVSQSSSDSESILSNPTDVTSDYQCMHRYSSASTISGPVEALHSPDSSQVDISV